MNDLKKTKNLGDLRARLGKNRDAASPSTKPGESAQPSSGSFPPPGGMRPSALPGAGGFVPGSSIAPPPFAAPQGAYRTKKSEQEGPYAVQRAAEPREVRLVIDGAAMSDSETGRKTGSRIMFAVIASAVLAAMVGWFGGSTYADRKLWNTVVGDAIAIDEAITKAEPKVLQAQKLVSQALLAAAPAEGKPTVDFKAIDDLLALEKPIDASIFARRHYRALSTTTVDQLFEYYNSVGDMWGEFRAVAAFVKGHKAQLAESIDAAEELRSSQYGCLITVAEGQAYCSLGVVTADPGQRMPSKVSFASRAGVRGADKPVYKGDGGGSDNVVLVDSTRSLGVLGKRASDFAHYLEDIKALDAKLKKTVELQGSLIQELGKIKSLR